MDYMTDMLSGFGITFLFALSILPFLCMLDLLANPNKRIIEKLIWFLILFFFSILGGIAYLIFRNKNLMNQPNP